MSTHNLSFCGEIRKKICGYPLLSGSTCSNQYSETMQSDNLDIFYNIGWFCEQAYTVYICLKDLFLYGMIHLLS